MTMRERGTLALVLVLAGVGAWLGYEVWSRGGVTHTPIYLLGAAAALVLGIGGALFALVASRGDRRVDERDRQVTYRAQMVRGFFYLSLAWGVFGILLGWGYTGFAVGMFLAFIGIELASGLVMLVLYRRTA